MAVLTDATLARLLDWRAETLTGGRVHAVAFLGRSSVCGDVPADQLTGTPISGAPVCAICVQIGLIASRSPASDPLGILPAPDPLPSG